MKKSWPLLLLALLVIAFFLRSKSERVRPTSSAPVPHPEEIVPAPIDLTAKTAPTPVPESTAPAPAEPEDKCMASLLWLLHHQNEDGSWGDGVTTLSGHTLDKPGVTALALLSFLGAGYSHLSKDTYEGKSTGVAVRKALQWLMGEQTDEGTFRSSRGTTDHALAALALSEAYGLTGSNLFKENAQRGLDALTRMQRQDGSWGDSIESIRAGEALKSAEVSGLTHSSEAFKRARDYFKTQLEAGPNVPAMLGHILLSRDKTHPGVALTAGQIASRPVNPDSFEYDQVYFSAMALFQYDGSEGATWKEWNEPFKRALLRFQERKGEWRGGTESDTVVRTSLATLSLEVYYRYAHVFSVK